MMNSRDMSPEELIRYILSFLGGGVVAAVGNWIHANRSARRQREVAWLQEQIRSLYGPISFFTTQNEQLLKLAGNVHEAGSAHFANAWSEDNRTQNIMQDNIDCTIKLGNMYVERVVENNARIMAILEAHWHLADPVDEAVFAGFKVDQTRFVTEVKQEGRKGVPFSIMHRPRCYRKSEVGTVRASVPRKEWQCFVLNAARSTTARLSAPSVMFLWWTALRDRELLPILRQSSMNAQARLTSMC
jgi:hypothetical protein